VGKNGGQLDFQILAVGAPLVSQGRLKIRLVQISFFRPAD
jgi:hypothetical protein